MTEQSIFEQIHKALDKIFKQDKENRILAYNGSRLNITEETTELFNEPDGRFVTKIKIEYSFGYWGKKND
mgnify:CR=1 FL=1